MLVLKAWVENRRLFKRQLDDQFGIDLEAQINRQIYAQLNQIGGQTYSRSWFFLTGYFDGQFNETD